MRKDDYINDPSVHELCIPVTDKCTKVKWPLKKDLQMQQIV